MNLLDVLPGWPEAEVLSDLSMFLLLFGAPIAFAVIVALLVFGPKYARRGREEVHSTDLEPRHQ